MIKLNELNELSNAEVCSKLVVTIVNAIMDKDHNSLLNLKKIMGKHLPYVSEKLNSLEIDEHTYNLIMFDILYTIIRSSLCNLELIRPEEAIKYIKYGKEILLYFNMYKDNDGIISFPSLSFENVVEFISKTNNIENDKILKSIVSKSICRLEMTGFIRRVAITENKNEYSFCLLKCGKNIIENCVKNANI